ncbi:Probable RNA-directed DNA polymerase from transposon X-element [Eumeta japonica]|uniref:Probable RNA-directed DNA polymerase from transposon X-element n=1 Tax=Eumeta variegata TaxID=151549 RepID=A0A4C1YA07_EUMVA|nr:Probable RNA-directed DNA polymerase from transposon X-element [Eumeta japonica]
MWEYINDGYPIPDLVQVTLGQWLRDASGRFRHPRNRRKFPPDVLDLMRAKNTALHRASAYPTPKYRSRARALQREVRAHVQEFRNESWSDFQEEIVPTLKAFWKVTKALKTEEYIPVPPLKRKPHDLPASYRPISLLSGLGILFEKTLKTRLSDHLLGKGLIIDEQFGFHPVYSCPQRVLHLVEYASEDFKLKKQTVAVFFDVAKAFDKITDTSHPDMSALTRPDVLSEQEFLKAPPCLSCCTPRIRMTYRGRCPASNSRYSPMIPLSTIRIVLGNGPSSTSREQLMSWVNGSLNGGQRTVMTYVSPVFAHAALKALDRLQDLELPTLSKYMKDASKRFFEIAGSYFNALLRAAVDYGPPPSTHFIRRPRSVLNDPPDALTATVESLNDVNDTYD